MIFIQKSTERYINQQLDSKTSKDIRPNDYLFPIRLTDSSSAEIEYNLQVSEEWHFKQKLAAVLEQEKAYNILKCYRSSGKEQSTFKIYLDKYVELTDLDKAIILQQVKATQETINLVVGKFEIITDLEIIMPEPEQSCMIEQVKEVEQTSKNNSYFERKKLQPSSELLGIWSRVRKSINIVSRS